MINSINCRGAFVAALAASAIWPCVAVAQVPATASARPADTSPTDDIIVTARRREESAQTVPVAVVALTPELLEQRGVRSLTDLTTSIAGFRMFQDSGPNLTTVTLRGLAQIPIGDNLPAVVLYFAEVPFVGDGNNLPTYDLAGVQVYKGPQGTLFGRNAVGGAVVVTPVRPTYELNGYARATIGNYQYRAIEGAINIPIVADRVALRLSGQIRRRHGTIDNLTLIGADPSGAQHVLSGGKSLNNIRQESFRASLLLEPAENFTNLTVFSSFDAKERPNPALPFEFRPAAAVGIESAFGLPAGTFQTIFDQQRAIGPDGVYADGEAYVNRRHRNISNITTLDLGGITFKNVFGYRHISNSTRPDNDATPLIAYTPTFALTPLTAITNQKREYFTDEFQILGTTANKRLEYIFGAFYNFDRSVGPAGVAYKSFNVGSYDDVFNVPPVLYTTSHTRNRNFAVYGQLGLDLGSIGLTNVKANLGGRYSWDRVGACGAGVTGRYLSPGECRSYGVGNPNQGAGSLRTKDSQPSWTIGLDYTASENLFLYVTSRHSYRGAGINTPLFNDAATTGGALPPAYGDPAFATCSIGTQVVPCLDLRPYQFTKAEKVTDIEIGAKTSFRFDDGSVARFNIDGYRLKNKGSVQFVNLLATGIPFGDPATPNNFSVGVNAADITVTGIEADASLNLRSGLNLSGTLAYTHQKLDSLLIPPALAAIGSVSLSLPSPKWAYTLAASYTPDWLEPFGAKLTFAADYYWQDKFQTQGQVFLPSYDVANFRVDLKNIGGTGLTASAYVKNAFNNFYWVGPGVLVAAFPIGSAQRGDPREFGAELTFRF